MDEIISKLNQILANPSPSTINSLFDPDSHIRFNNIFISPISLIDLKNHLLNLGLVSWQIIEDGIILRFPKLFIHFQGFYEINIINNSNLVLYSFELNFEPITSSDEGRLIMQSIENFLRKADSMFFLTYVHNVDAVLLNGNLSGIVPFLMRK